MRVPGVEMGPKGVDIRICLIMVLEIVDWGHMYLVDRLHWSSQLQSLVQTSPIT